MNARSALFDLYGDHLRSRGGRARVASLVALLAPLGIAAPAVRTAVSRMVKQGWLKPAGWTGRRATRSPHGPSADSRTPPPASTAPVPPAAGTVGGTCSCPSGRLTGPPASGCVAGWRSSATRPWATATWVGAAPVARAGRAARGRARSAPSASRPTTRRRSRAGPPGLGPRRRRPRRTSDGSPTPTHTRRGAAATAIRRGCLRRPEPARARVAQVPVHRPRSAPHAAPRPTGPATPPPTSSTATAARLLPASARFVDHCLSTRPARTEPPGDLPGPVRRRATASPRSRSTARTR